MEHEDMSICTSISQQVLDPKNTLMILAPGPQYLDVQ